MQHDPAQMRYTPAEPMATLVAEPVAEVARAAVAEHVPTWQRGRLKHP
eukprot:COSAG01_NODE_508_length_16107_cov_120.001187_18_plen_48_part_00